MMQAAYSREAPGYGANVIRNIVALLWWSSLLGYHDGPLCREWYLTEDTSLEPDDVQNGHRLGAAISWCNDRLDRTLNV